MTLEETIRLCRAIASLAPAQRFDDETPAIWSVVLADTRYGDARDAVITLARRQRFIAPADIQDEVRRMRCARLDLADPVTPHVHPDDVTAWRTELLALRRAIADGLITPDEYVESRRPITGAKAWAAIEGPKGDPLDVEHAFSRPPRPKAADYGTTPVQIRHDVDQSTAVEMERERERQLAAIDEWKATNETWETA